MCILIGIPDLTHSIRFSKYHLLQTFLRKNKKEYILLNSHVDYIIRTEKKTFIINYYCIIRYLTIWPILIYIFASLYIVVIQIIIMTSLDFIHHYIYEIKYVHHMGKPVLVTFIQNTKYPLMTYIMLTQLFVDVNLMMVSDH